MDTIKQLIEYKGSHVWSIGPDEKVLTALQEMAVKNAGALAVVKNDLLVGIISERDYTRKVVLEGKSSDTSLVKEIMTNMVSCASLEQKISECVEIMDNGGFRHMPVLADGKLVGMLSLKDLVRVLLNNNKILIRDLESYINA